MEPACEGYEMLRGNLLCAADYQVFAFHVDMVTHKVLQPILFSVNIGLTTYHLCLILFPSIANMGRVTQKQYRDFDRVPDVNPHRTRSTPKRGRGKKSAASSLLADHVGTGLLSDVHFAKHIKVASFPRAL